MKKAYGIDIQESMIATANRNRSESGTRNVEFKMADARKLPFPEKYFDVVMCIHAPFYTEEV